MEIQGLAEEQLQDLEIQLRALVGETGGFGPDFPQTSDFYSDLGLPSIKAMELLQGLEERFNVRVPDEEFVEATTLEKLSGLMARLVAEQT